MAAQHYWQNRDPHTQKWVPVFPLCTNTSILAPAISLTTRLYSHLCSIYNQKYCHFIVVCNMFDQHPTIINNRCMDYTTSARETKTILLFFLIFIVPLCNWSTLQMLNYFMCNLHNYVISIYSWSCPTHPIIWYCSPLENYENVPCSLRVIQTMPSK